MFYINILLFKIKIFVAESESKMETYHLKESENYRKDDVSKKSDVTFL